MMNFHFNLKNIPNHTICLFAGFALILGAKSNQLLAQAEFSVHGHLTQAYAISDDHQIFGIPVEGTSDYRTLALQFRYDLNVKNNFVIQFSHRRMGQNPVTSIENDVILDWGFYQYNFSERTSFKAGKIQMPIGIYNEIRDVGVLLPFYSVPFSPYGSGNYMSETLDGISISHNCNILPSWPISMDLFAGYWNWVEWKNIINPLTGTPTLLMGTIEVEKGLGGRLWLQTPLDGLRVGINGFRGHAFGGITFSKESPVGPQDFKAFIFSLDGTFDRFFIRGEYARFSLDKTAMFTNIFNSQAGIFLFEKFGVSVNWEYMQIRDIDVPTPRIPIMKVSRASFDLDRDFAVGLRYFFSANVVLKLEGHWNKSFLAEEIPMDYLSDKPVVTRYTIFSLATSF